MKILIVPSWFPTTLHPESGSFFLDRAKILKNSGIDVIVAAPVMHSLKDGFHFNHSKYVEFLSDEDLPVYIFEFINIFPKMYSLQFKRYKKYTVSLLKRVIKQNGVPDIIFVNSSIWAGAAIMDMCNKLDVPLIISEHLKEFLISDGFSKLKKKLIEKTYESCSGIIATSSALKNSIINSFPKAKSKISIIPNPVDEDIFVKKTTKRGNVVSIICISLFRSEKRLDLIIQSFYELLQSGEKAELTIAGDGPLKSKIIKQIQELNLSRFVYLKGYLEQNRIIEELQKSDLLILASDLETFGVVLIEAQACGLPVIATDCGGPGDIVFSDTGILVKPGSSIELTNGLKQMIRELNNYNSDNIRIKTVKKFGKHIYSDSIINLLNKIINR